jgi:hypothetical protein
VTKARKITTMLLLSLAMALCFAVPAYASASGEAQQSAYDAYDWVWCEAGYSNYC